MPSPGRPTKWPCHLWLGLLCALSLLGCSSTNSTTSQSITAVTRVPDSVRNALDLSPFYQKYLDANGLPVLGSTNVSDNAMREATWIIQNMLALHPEVLRVMATNRARLVVMAFNEYTTDVPEYTNRSPKVFWDRRARGLGGRV